MLRAIPYFRTHNANREDLKLKYESAIHLRLETLLDQS